MSDTPRTDETDMYDYFTAVDFGRMLERELDVMTKERNEFRSRAWHAESRLETRYGLRKEINAELGLTDETGDDALRKGLETIKALKASTVWRPIDTVPKDLPVLILATNHFNGDPIVCSAIYDGDLWMGHGTTGYDLENEFDSRTITHWMPLPEPQKDENHAA